MDNSQSKKKKTISANKDNESEDKKKITIGSDKLEDMLNEESKENKDPKENRESIKQNKNQEEEDRDKRSYKSMFRLAQYLYYYRCKVEENNIVINTNTNNDDKIHFGNKKFYEGQMRTLLDICEGKFGRV